jgi:hypothetical protein
LHRVERERLHAMQRLELGVELLNLLVQPREFEFEAADGISVGRCIGVALL